VAVFGGARQRCAALTTHEDRDCATYWFRKAAYVVEAHEFAGKAGHLPAPQSPHHGDILARASGAALKRHAERRELLRHPTWSHAEGESPGGGDVEAGNLLGQDQRVVLRHQADSRRQPDGSRYGPCPGQCGEWVEPVGGGLDLELAAF